MDRAQSRHFYRYFEPADRFVRIRRLEPSSAARELSPDLDAAGYKRTLLSRCVEGWDTIEVEDREAAEEELYRLVVDVNPDLDLRAIRIPEGTAAETRRDPDAGRARRLLRRLARNVEERLAERVVGQTHAIEAVAGVVRRAALGWNERGPLASLLFIGPTGVGKTELARALAQELGGDETLVRVDCSEFAEGHEYAKLVGAPPGYVGHAEGGILSDAVERVPNAVVLFDEIEKAHPRLHHLLLQILDEGRLTDGRGKRIDFQRSFVLMTSNLGTSELREAEERSIGFVREELPPQTREEIVGRALLEQFRPEFLGRLDEVVVFRALTRAEGLRIARSQLASLAARVRRSGPRVCFTSAVERWVADHGTSRESGARGIAGLIRREIEAPLAERLLADDPGRGGWLRVSIQGGRPRFGRAA